MAIINTITSASQAWDFVRSFQCMESWNYDQFSALFDCMEQLSDDMGEHIELDPIAWASDWSPYDTLAEAADNMVTGWRDYLDDDDDIEDVARDVLQDNGSDILDAYGSYVVRSC